MKMKKLFKCLLMTMALLMVVNVGAVASTIPAAAKAKTETVKKGTKFWSGKLQYKVVSLNGKTGTAALIDAKTNVTSVAVPETVKKGSYTLTVTEIGSGAFENCRKLKKVVTNTELQKIGKNAFSGCKKLAAVDIRSTELKSVGKNAMKGIAKEAVVSVPEGMAVSYEKKLKVSVQESETEVPAPKAAETSVVQAPAPKVVETPVASAPEVPVQTKVTEAPKTPATEAATKAPETTAPETEAETKAPETKAPTEAETKAPETTAPETEAETKAPETEVLTEAETKAPETTAPATEAETKAPETEALTEAETKAPETEAPTEAETKAPETEAPTEAETKAPVKVPAPKRAPKASAAKAPATEAETKAPETTAPTTEAETKAPETTAPTTEAETKAPETTAPTTEAETKAPQTETPATEAETKAPETTAPATEAETKASETMTPATEAETKAPETTTPATEAETKAPKTATPATEAETKTPTETGTEAPETEAPTEAETETPETEHVCKFTWVVTDEPICGIAGNDMTWRNTGTRTGTCSICGKVVTEGIRAEHQLVVTKDVEPTCTMHGATYSTCTVCGYQSVRLTDENGKYRKPLGHDMVFYEEPVTCTEDGRTYEKCSRCGLVENETITAKKTGHDFASGEVTVVRDATCIQDGQSEIACAHEGCTAKRSKRIPAKGHEFREETVAATCYQDEQIVKTCANCNYRSIQTIPGTRKEHNLAVKDQRASTVDVQGYVEKRCANDGCTYKVTEMLPLAKCEHSWVHVTGGENDREGVLASWSDGKIRTERCTSCNELRYAYNPSGDKETWVSWEEVTCNGAGHIWKEPDEKGHVYCETCGTVKPEKDTSGLGNSRSRIVWGATFEAEADDCVGFRLQSGGMSYSAMLTTISADNLLKVPAPEAHSGRTFKNWTWNREGEIPDDLFAKKEDGSVDRTTLLLSCDYMDMTFTANYTSAAEAQSTADPAQESSIDADPTKIPEVIHGEMHVDLSGELSENLPAESFAHEDQDVTEHDEPLEESETAGMTEMAG